MLTNQNAYKIKSTNGVRGLRVLNPCAMAAEGKEIVIVGAGMGGLVAATALCRLAEERRLRVKVTILERDESSSSQDESFQYNHAMSITADSGAIDVLKRLGLFREASEKQTHVSSFFLADTDGKSDRDLYVVRDTGLRLPRLSFRRLLLDRIPPEATIEWGCAVESLADTPRGVELSLRGGRTVRADIVIAADGHHSAVRASLVPSECPSFAGAALLGGVFSGYVPRMFQHRHGTMFGPRNSIWMAHDREDAIAWRIAFETVKPLADSGDALHDRAADLAAQFPAAVREIVTGTPSDQLSIADCYDKMPHRSVLGGRVIFIGDAAHPIALLGGIGANLAIVDAWRVADALTDNNFTIGDAARAFDDAMVKRGSAAVKKGRKMMKESFGLPPLAWTMRAVRLRALNMFVNRPVLFFGIVGAVIAAAAGGVAAIVLHGRQRIML